MVEINDIASTFVLPENDSLYSRKITTYFVQTYLHKGQSYFNSLVRKCLLSTVLIAIKQMKYTAESQKIEPLSSA